MVYSQDMDKQALLDKTSFSGPMHLASIQENPVENILLKCLFFLTGSADFRKSMENTLKEIGRYYGADRAYVVELERETADLLELYEWKKEEERSIRTLDSTFLCPRSLSLPAGEQMRKLRYIENLDTFEEHDPQLCRYLRSIGVFSFFTSSLVEDGTLVGYIRIDNPRQNTGNISAIDGLLYFLTNELIKRRLQKRQEYLSYHDEMTGMLNRNSYKDYAESLKEEGLISLGVISLDINGLKEINRNHGNSYGDDIVRYIARILKEELSMFKIYRFTGDEFLALCENIAYDTFLSRAHKASDRLKDICSISMGTAWSDTDISLNSLSISADERRLIAKQNYYEEKQYGHKRKNAKILKGLLKALSQRRFLVYMQPKIDSRDGSLYGAEALVRYQDDTAGLVAPGKFIQYLENAGLIHHIDLFVFEEVCRVQAEWRQRGLPRIPVSLNFSRSTLLEENLIAQMDGIAGKYEADKSLIEIEITESLGEVERNTIAAIGSQIRQAGCRLSLDDFGSKYSNLSFLSALHFNTLKLDKGLANNLISNENARIIVKNILNLCRELEITVVAEGVEVYEQLEVLKRLECWYIQGYYYNKPLPVKEFEAIYMKKE
ncbi:bifunctional diguanylate cyclase/phosphodiesterase [Clostridium sp. AM58-1XD]|uniref:bifunctional diguanylate cyclase/phosphodiesterase n=1 Tax=Clostridium sp. AM58-1XD TaxID=2292307 RepID=UPI0015F42B27|nr:bifunctional diguanylate cyclase/phosphodiesterase [Clostridium sp. AM58-1XD]